MRPHGYHHNGFMATPALGTQEVRLHIVSTALWSHQSAQTVNSEQCIVQKVNVPQGGSSPNPRECSNCLGSGRNIQRITMCPHGYHHNGFMATPALGTQEVRLHIVWTALWSHQSAQTVNSIYIYLYIYINKKNHRNTHLKCDEKGKVSRNQTINFSILLVGCSLKVVNFPNIYI